MKGLIASGLGPERDMAMRLWLRSRLASSGSSWASRAVSAQLGNRLLAKSRSCSLEAKRRSLPGAPCNYVFLVSPCLAYQTYAGILQQTGISGEEDAQGCCAKLHHGGVIPFIPNDTPRGKHYIRARTMEAMQLLLRVKHVASCTSACCCFMACNPTISAAGQARQSALSSASSLYLHHASLCL